VYAAGEPTEPEIDAYTTYNINNNEPDETETIQALKRMRLKKSLGPSRITIDMIRNYYRNAREEENQYQQLIEIWNKIAEIVKITFREGNIPIPFSYRVLVLIPKQDQSFRGIALLETIYKLISMIIHQQLLSTIKLHNAVHSFRTKRGRGTQLQ
jgi:hypothetical protein